MCAPERLKAFGRTGCNSPPKCHILSHSEVFTAQGVYRAKIGAMLGTFGAMSVPFGAIREVDRLWLQFQHTPNFRECGFSVSALLLGEPCAFGIEPQGAFLFRCELLQSRAHKRKLNPLEPIRRFARLHAEILPPSSRNLPQGREQRKCPPRWAERAGVASAGSSCRSGRSIPPLPRDSC